MNILELYSGIGSMHAAFKLSQVKGTVLTAVDIDPVANTVYSYNFYNKVVNEQIELLGVHFLQNLGINTVLMAPPSYPYLMHGQKLNASDPKITSLWYFLDILPQLKIDRFLLENAVGFHTSEMHQKLMNVLKSEKFYIKEYFLCSTKFGLPHKRCRYYCVAKKMPFSMKAETIEEMKESPFNLNQIILNDAGDNFDVPITYLQEFYRRLDIVYPNSTIASKFTEFYGQYAPKSGSVLALSNRDDVDDIYKHIREIDAMDIDEDSKNTAREKFLRKLNVRFFTPKEIECLMGFPEDFIIPSYIPRNKQYQMLSKSVNCKVVAALIKLLE